MKHRACFGVLDIDGHIGATAPEESVMVPVMEPLALAECGERKQKQARERRQATHRESYARYFIYCFFIMILN